MCVLPALAKPVVMETPIWNQANLMPPPVCTVKSKWGKDVRILNCAVEKIIATLDSFDIMLYETKFLSAVINQFRFDFRLDKSFQLINRVAHCLKRCQSLNLKEVFQNFEKTSSQCNAFDYQPSRQMLEYVLVRVQGFIMLLKNLINLCHESALHLRAKMEIGHFPSVVLTLFSVVSRIWSLSKYYVENGLQWYLLLVSSLHTLAPTQVSWLPPGYVFPALPLELDKAPWIDQKKILDSLRSFLSGFDEPAAPSTSMGYLTKTDDLGETISREDLASLRRALPVVPVEKKPIQEKKTPVQNKPVHEKKIRIPNKPIQAKKIQLNKPIQEKNTHLNQPILQKKTHIPGAPMQVRDKSSSVANTGSESTKRKISESEQETLPSKHFFKKRYTRPVDSQADSRTPEPKLGSTDVTPTNIMQELAELKQDLANLGGKPKSKPVGLDPKYKSKVFVVQEKSKKVPEERSAGKSMILDRRKVVVQEKSKKVPEDHSAGKSMVLDRRKIVQEKSVETRGDDSEKPKKLCQVGSSESRNRSAVRDPEPRDVSSKKMLSKEQRRLERRKELAKLKKQKSKSWVIS